MAMDYKQANARDQAGRDYYIVLDKIEWLSRSIFIPLLLARFLILNLLIDVALSQDPTLKNVDDYRRLWVLLQAQPQLFKGDFRVDIFTDLSRMLWQATASTWRLLQAEYEGFCTRVKLGKVAAFYSLPMDPPIFCVLDNGQYITSKCPGDFCTLGTEDRRPVLQELWQAWTSSLREMRYIYSGTSIEIQDLCSPRFNKPGAILPFDLKYDFGGFDCPEDQAAYIKRYVPANWSEPRWEDFLVRSWGWFRGR
jgi:hypothetical protein